MYLFIDKSLVIGLLGVPLSPSADGDGVYLIPGHQIASTNDLIANDLIAHTKIISPLP
jgi:hypothetical protein